MEIYYFDILDSTQKWLIENVKNNVVLPPCCVCAKRQSDGVGSRGNKWECVNEALTFSFVLSFDDLPSDLPLCSSAIYFGFLFKEVLKKRGSKVWLKWPNDIYREHKKVGGIIVSNFAQYVICGIGINLKTEVEEYGVLEDDIDQNGILEEFIKKDFSNISWKRIFSKYKLEFHLNNDFTFHKGEELVSMRNMQLLDDGSLTYKGEIFFCAR